MKRSIRIAAAALLTMLPLAARADAPRADAPAAPEPREERGSVVTSAPLGPGRVSMSLGGGVAVILPFYAFEAGVGVSRTVDIVGRFESVVGVLHYPHVGVRWNPIDVGRWKIGTRLLAHYSFFGIRTDQTNLTSTFYVSGDLSASGPVTRATDLLLGVESELDVFEYDVVDDDARVDGAFGYDATILRLGMKTRLTEDLDGYAIGRLRVPVETLTYDATSLYVVPFLEIGGTWSF